jgi:hypothetical protein
MPISNLERDVETALFNEDASFMFLGTSLGGSAARFCRTSMGAISSLLGRPHAAFPVMARKDPDAKDSYRLSLVKGKVELHTGAQVLISAPLHDWLVELASAADALHGAVETWQGSPLLKSAVAARLAAFEGLTPLQQYAQGFASEALRGPDATGRSELARCRDALEVNERVTGEPFPQELPRATATDGNTRLTNAAQLPADRTSSAELAVVRAAAKPLYFLTLQGTRLRFVFGGAGRSLRFEGQLFPGRADFAFSPRTLHLRLAHVLSMFAELGPQLAYVDGHFY